MGKRPASDSLCRIVITATELALQKASCTDFIFLSLLPALMAAGVFTDEERTDSVVANERWRGRVFKRISRIIQGEQALPADWVIPWLSAFPSELRERCRNSLAAALGIMPVRIMTPDVSQYGARANIDLLSREFADVISASRPAMDGSYSTTDDRGELQLLQNELQELANRVLDEIVAIAASTGVTPAKFGEVL